MAAALKNFTLGLKRDYEVVKAGFMLEWPQRAVEGHAHRLKLIKRQSYSQASFQTLRKRVLCCASPLVGEKLVSLFV
ncbi:transposase [Dictyobacter formicarum]|uniref:Uncharacterized protein n=1 Tax=Dictyobacter formicarum TaxID=2778368 RepID=A0ABQ3VF95_9CHLR|nr:transposase [Dictyobacter formicarum]GHO84384.1 hypothetical protein KSZ_23900 [Dictyobacter formicarum]